MDSGLQVRAHTHTHSQTWLLISHKTHLLCANNTHVFVCVILVCLTQTRGCRLCGWHVTVCQRLTRQTSGKSLFSLFALCYHSEGISFVSKCTSVLRRMWWVCTISQQLKPTAAVWYKSFRGLIRLLTRVTAVLVLLKNNGFHPDIQDPTRNPQINLKCQEWLRMKIPNAWVQPTQNTFLKQSFCCRYVVKFLARLAQDSEVNKMTPSNIAIVLGPNLLWAKTEG